MEYVWQGVAIAVLIVVLTAILALLQQVYSKNKLDSKKSETKKRIPESVNYHFTRQCNYECGFCFHTAKTSFVLPIEEAKRGLMMLKDAG